MDDTPANLVTLPLVKLTKAELLTRLVALQAIDDPEVVHEEADHLLMHYINDEEIRAAYESLTRWFG